MVTQVGLQWSYGYRIGFRLTPSTARPKLARINRERLGQTSVLENFLYFSTPNKSFYYLRNVK